MDSMDSKKFSLNLQILLAAIVGVTLGIILNQLGTRHPFTGPTMFVCAVIGKTFLGMLKMILIPIIFTSISVGIANLQAHAQMNRVWKLTLVYFMTTAALATLLGLVVVNIFKPGAGLNMNMFPGEMTALHKESLTLPEFFQSFLTGLFMNPVKAMADGQVLPTIVFAAMIGIAIIVAGEAKTKYIRGLLNEFLELLMIMIGWIMRLLPVGIFALLATLIASQDTEIIPIVGKFMLVVIGATLFHGFIVLPAILYVTTKRSPIEWFKGAKEALLTAFSTSSSSATIPVTLRCVEENLRVDKNVAGFVVPLGATINMDGTALYEAIAAIFVANLSGIELNLVQQTIVFFTAIVASVGAPGIPSAGMVTMIMVLQSVGLPIEAIGILIAIDRPLDAIRTMVNVEGDIVGSCVVDRYTTRGKEKFPLDNG